ncbi:MAG TPA: hypothetical protein VGB16_03830 [candidate division Zixibacteria bacterium]
MSKIIIWLKTYLYLILPAIVILAIVIVSIVFCLSASKIIQASVAGGTFLLAIAAFGSIAESRKQFRISKSPIFDVMIGGQIINNSNEIKLPLSFENIGYGTAFRVSIELKQGALAWNLEFPLNEFQEIGIGYAWTVGKKKTMTFSPREIAPAQIEKPLELEIKCDNIFRRRVVQKFSGNMKHGFRIENIEFA